MVNADEPHPDGLLDQPTEMAPSIGDDMIPHLLHQSSAIPPFVKRGRGWSRMAIPVSCSLLRRVEDLPLRRSEHSLEADHHERAQEVAVDVFRPPADPLLLEPRDPFADGCLDFSL